MSPSPCSTNADCTPTDCRWRCALSVIDELLGRRESVTGEEVDALLDLRWHLRQRHEAETVLRLFCELRRRMEPRHYLAFFRLRRWLENQLVAQTDSAQEQRAVGVKLDHYCVEALRRVALCDLLDAGATCRRLRFAFRAVPAASPVTTSFAAVSAG